MRSKQIEIPVPAPSSCPACHDFDSRRARREGNYYIPDLVMGSHAYLSETTASTLLCNQCYYT